ncbi:MAG TPA: carbohydrate porin [Pseudolabrys sp.]|nr:carbohydrate porin [Pseudolabrys sp.]
MGRIGRSEWKATSRWLPLFLAVAFAACPDATRAGDGDTAAGAIWSGAYVGGHVGYGRGRASPSLSGLVIPGSVGFGSLSGGLGLGYNWQFANGMVAGIETDLSFMDSHPGNDVIWAGVAGQGIVAESINYLGSLRARLGHAQDNWLIYITGGFAWAGSEMTRASAPGADDNVDRQRLRGGWSAGGGIAYAFAAPWSLRAEVLYYKFDSASVTFPGGPSYASHFDLWTARVGLDYRFGAGADGAAAIRAPDTGVDAPNWEIHAQSTYILQGYPRFRSPYVGANSLTPWPQAKSTWTTGAFIGVKLWEGGEVHINPELPQGFGLNGTVGVAGFPNGEAQKSDFLYPHFNLARLYLRQTFGFGGEQETFKSEYGQMSGKQDVTRLTVQVGRFAVHDLFDTNSYANDPRTDFLNWSIWAAGAFDYPADRLGYTYGAALDFNQQQWALRAGYFLIGKESNSSNFDMALFRRGGYVAEFEQRYSLLSRPGVIRLIGWMNESLSGGYRDAIALAATVPGLDINNAIVDTRRGRSKFGYVVNWEQAVTDDVGVFARWSWNNGRNEISAFTDIDASLSGGVVIKGTSWGRADDRIGLAGAVNGISKDHRDFLAAGGLGILVGDGRLNYGHETVLEAYYAARVAKDVTATADYQLVVNPGYNRDRGPVSVFSARLRWER